MVVDMTDRTLQLDSGSPNFSIYLPIPSESDSEHERNSTHSMMNIG